MAIKEVPKQLAVDGVNDREEEFEVDEEELFEGLDSMSE